MNSGRVAELEALIRSARAAYYDGAPLMSDAAFDLLEDELRALEPGSAVLVELGAAPVSEWEKARHSIPMGSLNKVVNAEELREWAERCDALALTDGLAPISNDLYVTEKLDGLSLALGYEKGALSDAITRGDGLVGELITSNARRMQGVPHRLPEPLSISVRGEIILRISVAKEKFPQAVSPRNMAAGTAKRFDGTGAELLDVICYDLEGEEFVTEKEKADRLQALGFKIPPYQVTDVAGVIALHEAYATGRRAALDHEIDGLVVRANQVRVQQLLGELGHRPRAATAFKFASQAKVSKVVAITWETGPSGRVSPVANVEPVAIAGAIVRRAGLHNVKNVEALGVGVGDEVLVSRRNDVIPYVEEVVVKHGPPATIPTACNVCAAALVRVGEYLLCRNRECPALVEGRIRYWVGAQGILEWGEKLIAQLVAAKLVREPADLYGLKEEQIAALERRGDLIAKKLVENLRAALPIDLPTFLAALGIEGFALQTAKLIVAAGFDTIEKVQAATAEQLAEIHGLGPIKAEIVVAGLRERSAEIARLAAVGVVPVASSAAGPLAGKSFCFTGALSKPRKEYEDLVEKLGGTVRTAVTKGLDYLVIADANSTSSKAEKARKYGTACIDEAGFLALVPT